MQGASELHCAEEYNTAAQHAIFSTLDQYESPGDSLYSKEPTDN